MQPQDVQSVRRPDYENFSKQIKLQFWVSETLCCHFFMHAPELRFEMAHNYMKDKLRVKEDRNWQKRTQTSQENSFILRMFYWSNSNINNWTVDVLMSKMLNVHIKPVRVWFMLAAVCEGEAFW